MVNKIIEGLNSIRLAKMRKNIIALLGVEYHFRERLFDYLIMGFIEQYMIFFT